MSSNAQSWQFGTALKLVCSLHGCLYEELCRELTAVGFEPTQLALVELESTPLDHSGKLSLS